MKKLCFGSFGTVLSCCRASSVSQKKLIGSMLLSINPNYDIRDDDVAVTALVRGKNNLSDNVLLYLDDAAPTLSDTFAGQIIPLLDANKKASIVLAFKDILFEDTGISDDTVIELINRLTKADFLQRNCIVFEDLVAGLFLYVAKYTDNHEMKKFIAEITPTYIRGFNSRRDEITFIPSYSIKNEGVIKTVAADARVIELMAEAEGTCPMCGKILSADQSVVVPLGNGDDILLCLDCAAKVQNSAEEKNRAAALKDILRINAQMTDAVSANRLVDEVRELLVRIKDISADDISIRKTPLRVEKKVSDHLLLRKIRSYILDGMYDSINTCIEQLASENRLNVLKLSKCVRRMFEDAEMEGGNQEEVFNAIAEGIFRQSGRTSYSACELLVSYFVQRCEVFNEITG